MSTKHHYIKDYTVVVIDNHIHAVVQLLTTWNKNKENKRPVTLHKLEGITELVIECLFAQ